MLHKMEQVPQVIVGDAEQSPALWLVHFPGIQEIWLQVIAAE